MCCAIFACLAPNSILASGTVRSPSSLGLTRRHRKKNTHDPKCLARSACRYLQPTNVRVAGNLIAARKSMIWKMDENGDDLLFQLGYYTGGNLSWFCCPTRLVIRTHMGRDLSDISLYPGVLRGAVRCDRASDRRSHRRPTRAFCASRNLRAVSGPVGQSTPSLGGSRPVCSHPRRPPPP